MKQLERLSSALNIQPGEGRLFLLLFCQFFLLGVSFNFLETTAFPLFLTEFTPQTLPYIYIANAFVVPLIIGLYLRLGNHVSFASLLILNLSFLLLILIVFWLGLALTEARWLVFGLPILFQVVVSLGFIAFWTLAGRFFNVRQAKRLFGLLGSGFWIAIVVTGFIIPILVGLVGTINLLFIAAVGMACALALLVYITRAYADSLTILETGGPAVQDKQGKTDGHVLKNRYVILMFALSVVAWLSFFFVDNIFYNRVAAQFPDEDQVASFLGLYLAGLGILTLLINTFLTGPILNRYGMRTGLLLLPLTLLVVTLLFITSGTIFGLVAILFWLATLNRLFDLSLTFSVDQSAQTILYQPLPADQRSRVQTIDEGIVRMVGIGVAGGLLLLLNNVLGANVLHLAYVSLIIILVWIGAVFLIGREYPLALMNALAKRNLDDTSLLRPDRSSVTILQQNLESPHLGVVLYALDHLEALETDAYPAILQGLLDHPEREVRLDVLRRIERLELTAIMPTLQEKLKYEGSRPVRGVLLRTLAALGESEAFDLIYPYLDDPDPWLRQGALIGLLRSGELEGTLAAGEKLQAGITAADPAERAFVARVLGEAGLSGLYRPLLKLIQDDQSPVQRTALEAAGKVKHPKLWSAVAEALTRPQVRASAATALIAGGQEVLPVLETAVSYNGPSVEVLSQIARICGRLGGERAINLLYSQVKYPNERVRTQMLQALSRCGYQAHDDESRTFVHQQIKAEATQAVWLLGAQVKLGEAAHTEQAKEANSLLIGAIDNLLARHRLRLLMWLSFIYDRASVLRVRDILSPTGANARPEQQRAYALEVIDVLLPTEQKSRVLPLLEDLSPAQRLQRLVPLFPQPDLSQNQYLEAISSGALEWFSPWSKICGWYALKKSGGVASSVTENDQFDSPQQGAQQMLSMIEKVILLKSIDFFTDTSEDVLLDVASILEDVEVSSGEIFLQKGDLDSSMYLLIEGQVRVHDGDRTVAELGQGEVLGELALLDPAPRSASVTAVTDSRLFRLDQEPFYELLEDRSEVARKMLQVMARRLRRSSSGQRQERARDDLLGGLQEKLVKPG